MRIFALSAVLGLFVACSSSTSTTTDAPSPSSDAGPDAAPSDLDAQAPADSSTNPDASPAGTTSVAVVLNSTTRTLTRAQFGKNTDGTLHVEAHLGGDAACPTESSPSPMYTLVIDGVPGAAPAGSFLDFQGDVLTGGKPATKATAIQATNVQTTATSTSFDVTITFAEGTATGHVAADYCASLDE